MKRVAFCAILISTLVPLVGAPITSDRIRELPAAEQPAWQKYLKQSQAIATKDRDMLQAELTAHGMTAALRTPDGGDFKLPAKPGDPWYAGKEAQTLTDIILSYQAPSGGWSKHTAYSAGPRKVGMQWTSQSAPGEPAHYLATFDNRSTTEQMHYLAYVWDATQREDCKTAFIKGLNYIMAAQNPKGGWPQVFPLEGVYHDDITYNDDGMTHVLELLEAICEKETYYRFLTDAQRAEAAKALASGIDCVLKTQVEQKGKKTVWCAQHDSITLQPSHARAMEPATLSGTESAHILEFLMTIKNPSPQIVAAIEGGLAWFEKAKIAGIKKTERDGKTVYEADASSTEIYWARFYDLATGKPVFPGRDGVLYDTFEALADNNHVGYDYYSTQPGSMLNVGQKRWRKLMAQTPATTQPQAN